MEQKLLKRVEEANSLRKKGLDLENEIKEFLLNPENSHIFLLYSDRDKEFMWMLMDGSSYDEYSKFTLTFSANEKFMNATDPAQAISRSESEFNMKMKWWTEQVQKTLDEFLKIQKLGLSSKDTLWKQYASSDEDQIAAVEPLWKLKGCDYLPDHVREVTQFLRDKDLIFSWGKGFENDMTIVFKVYTFSDTLNVGKRRVAQFLGFISFSTKSIKNVDWNCSKKNCDYSCYCKPSEITPRWTVGRPYSSESENVRSGHRCGIDKANFKEWLKFTFSKVFKGKTIDGMEPSLKSISHSVVSQVNAEETALEEQKAVEKALREFEEASRALQEKQEALERVQKRRKVAVE